MTTQQGAARSVAPAGEYPVLPEPFCNAHSDADSEWPDMFSACQMRAYADATCAIRAVQPASGLDPELGPMLDFANAGEIAFYDYAVAQHCRATLDILDGKDNGAGACNEPWASVRKRLLSIVELHQSSSAARLEIESLRGRSVPVSEADMVLAAMETGEWELQRLLPQTCFTSEANIRNAWSVKRSAAPYCTKDGLRIWTGATPLEALCNGAAALGVELPGCSETAALPKTVVAILGEQAELRRLSDCCPELNLSNYGPDDVDELNGWAIEVSQCIDRALAAQPAGAQQPGVAYAVQRASIPCGPLIDNFPPRPEPAIWHEGGGFYNIYQLELFANATYALRASHGQAPAQAGRAYKDRTPELHVGDSAFESWYSTYNPAHKSDKQRASDAFAAGVEWEANRRRAETPFAWAEFDGEGGYYLCLYEDNEGYRDEFLKRNPNPIYKTWVFPLVKQK